MVAPLKVGQSRGRLLSDPQGPQGNISKIFQNNVFKTKTLLCMPRAVPVLMTLPFRGNKQTHQRHHFRKGQTIGIVTKQSECTGDNQGAAALVWNREASLRRGRWAETGMMTWNSWRESVPGRESCQGKGSGAGRSLVLGMGHCSWV